MKKPTEKMKQNAINHWVEIMFMILGKVEWDYYLFLRRGAFCRRYVYCIYCPLNKSKYKKIPICSAHHENISQKALIFAKRKKWKYALKNIEIVLNAIETLEVEDE